MRRQNREFDRRMEEKMKKVREREKRELMGELGIPPARRGSQGAQGFQSKPASHDLPDWWTKP